MIQLELDPRHMVFGSAGRIQADVELQEKCLGVGIAGGVILERGNLASKPFVEKRDETIQPLGGRITGRLQGGSYLALDSRGKLADEIGKAGESGTHGSAGRRAGNSRRG